MLVVQETVYIKLFLNIKCLCNFIVSCNPIIQSVAIFTHKPEDPLLFCVWCHSVNLQQFFLYCVDYTLVLVLCRYVTAVLLLGLFLEDLYYFPPFPDLAICLVF